MSLFWRILCGFWLSLLLMGLGAGAVVMLYNEAKLRNPEQLAQDKRVGFILDNLARDLRLADAKVVIEQWQHHDHGPRRPPTFTAPPGQPDPASLAPAPATMPKPGSRPVPGPFKTLPLMVTPQGIDLLGRPVPSQAWRDAQHLAREQGDDPRATVRHVITADGQPLLLFILNNMVDQEHFLLFDILDTPLLLPLCALLSSLLFSALLARSLVRPIQILRDGLHQVAEGDFQIEVSAQMGARRDELGELGRDADRMARQLGQLMSSQKRLLNDISHDLRSPLARLQVAIGLARQKPERMQEMLDRLEYEAGRLDNMIGEVLTLARLESGVPYTQGDYLDLVALLQSLVEDARFESSGHSISLELDHLHEVVLPCHGELLWRAFDNLLRNALQHTPAGACVTLALSADDNGCRIQIQDTGPGVPPELLGEIFEPFHHADDTRGHGLGLAIAKRAIEAHGGTIAAENAPQGGLLITVTLPRPA